jgi:hypothetical protein
MPHRQGIDIGASETMMRMGHSLIPVTDGGREPRLQQSARASVILQAARLERPPRLSPASCRCEGSSSRCNVRLRLPVLCHKRGVACLVYRCSLNIVKT